MNTILVYDSETTGIPLWHDPSEDPRQPHIMQLAALLIDVETRRTLATLDVMVRPEGWIIPDDVSAIHGITTEMAADLGVPESLAVEMLLDLSRGRLRVAHNESFDRRLVRIACKRFFEELTCEEWAAGQAECTARLATPIMAIPPTDKMRRAGFTKPKTPNLSEAVRFFLGREHSNAHTALADVQGCADVWFAIRERQREAMAA